MNNGTILFYQTKINIAILGHPSLILNSEIAIPDQKKICFTSCTVVQILTKM